MRHTYIYILLFSFLTISAQDSILFSVGNQNTTIEDFVKTYYKNRLDTDTMKLEDSIDEYLDLYIKFKLKVIEAESLGLDTIPSFIRELEGYRRQLVKPYLTDSEITDQLLIEAYERLKYEVSVSHILIQTDQSDTLDAYNRILSISNKLKKGADFVELAKQFSEDPSVKDNQGDLGYFTALYMVYPFESAAYETPVGSISEPVKTRFGYHLLKVNDKRLSRGEVKVAHIMIKIDSKNEQSNMQSRQKIHEIYDSLRLSQGVSFAELAKKYSDDKQSAVNGGALDWFGANKMVKSFEDSAFLLDSIGEFSQPFATEFGWHIVQLLDRKKLPDFNELKTTLKTKIERDSRSKKTRNIVISRLKNEWGFVENSSAKNIFYDEGSKGFFSGENMFNKIKNKGQVMFVFNKNYNVADRYVYQQDFVDYLNLYKDRLSKDPDLKNVIDQLYQIFLEQKIIDLEAKNLEYKYDDFRLLMDEYHDGILLFNLSEKKVWDKAIQDTLGLSNFYKKRTNQYMWPNRVLVKVYSSKDEAINKKVYRALKWGSEDSELLKKINKNSSLNLSVEEKIFEFGDDKLIDHYIYSQQWSSVNKDDIIICEDVNKVLQIVETLPISVKPLNEIKGIVISDYQNFLETEWINELQNKYPVVIDQKNLDLVKEKNIKLVMDDEVTHDVFDCTSFSSCFMTTGLNLGYSEDVYFGWKNQIYTTELRYPIK